MNHLALGADGEDRAARWYLEHGYHVLDRNWRRRAGELDLVVCRRGEVVFCEVKTRTSVAFGLPQEAVTAVKQRRLRRLAAAWLAEHPGLGGEVRFDVAAVLNGRIEVIEHAF